MKRHEHVFQFSGDAICAAAEEEFKYHSERIKYWKAEQEIAIAKAKEAGIDVREHNVTGGKRVQIVIDPTLENRLSECANKITNHQQSADRFQIEAAAYKTQSIRFYDLHPEDVVYFRLAGGTRVE